MMPAVRLAVELDAPHLRSVNVRRGPAGFFGTPVFERRLTRKMAEASSRPRRVPQCRHAGAGIEAEGEILEGSPRKRSPSTCAGDRSAKGRSSSVRDGASSGAVSRARSCVLPDRLYSSCGQNSSDYGLVRLFAADEGAQTLMLLATGGPAVEARQRRQRTPRRRADGRCQRRARNPARGPDRRPRADRRASSASSSPGGCAMTSRLRRLLGARPERLDRHHLSRDSDRIRGALAKAIAEDAVVGVPPPTPASSRTRSPTEHA